MNPLIIVAIALIAVALVMGPSAVIVFFALLGVAILGFIGYAAYLERRK
jgi:hypothetical protein